MKTALSKTHLLLKRVFLVTRSYFRHEPVGSALHILFKLIITTIPLVSTFVLSRLIESLSAGRGGGSAAILWLSAMIFLKIIASLVGALRSVADNKFHYSMARVEKLSLAVMYDSLPLEFSDTQEGRRLIDDADMGMTCVGLIFFHFVDFISAVFTFICAAVTLFRYNVPLSLLVIAMYIPRMVLSVYRSKAFEEQRLAGWAKLKHAHYYSEILTSNRFAKDVRTYNLTDPLRENFEKYTKEYKKERQKYKYKYLLIGGAFDIAEQLGFIAFTAYLIFMAYTGSISVGEITLYAGFMASMTSSFSSVITKIGNMAELALVDMEHIVKLYSVPRLEDGYGDLPLEKFDSLEFADVYFKYPTGADDVLSGVSFTINRGERVSIIGINGSGKSTIIKLMIGLYEIDSGEIRINGADMKKYRIADIRKMFAVLFQEYSTFPLTIRENIALSRPGNLDEDQRIVDALKRAGIDEKVLCVSDGDSETSALDRRLGREFDDDGIELSQGQWQKVALARVYFKDADIVVLDEPSASLDAEAEDRIFKDFETAADDKTGIMISHRISSARKGSKVLVLNNGTIEEQGSHDELMRSGGLYAQMYELQRKKYVPEVGNHDED